MANRKAISNKFYLNVDGERSNSPTGDTTIVEFEFYTGEKDENDKNIVGNVIQLDGSTLNEAVQNQAMFHGIAQKIGDQWAGKGDQAEEICGTMIERLQAGEWNMAKGAGSGPRPSMVLKAVLNVLAQHGADIENEELISEVTAGLAVEGARADALKNPVINAAYETLRAEAAAKRAANATEKAAADTNESGGFLATFLGGAESDDDETVAQEA